MESYIQEKAPPAKAAQKDYLLGKDTKSLSKNRGLVEEIHEDVGLTTTVNKTLLEQLLKQYSIDLKIPLEPPPVLIQIKGKLGFAPFATQGTITLLTAKAKAGKTAAASLVFAAMLRNGEFQGIINSTLYPNKNVFYYFDTEQMDFRAQKIGQRILCLAENPNGAVFHYISLVKEPHTKKKDLIEKFIYNTPNLGAIVIDGGKDLILDINNPEQATIAVSDLVRWAADLKICIIVILHQNKNDNNARGHYGQELKNKAEVIANVSKDKDTGVYTIEPEDCRDIDFQPFAFQFDQQGLPYLLQDWTPPAAKEKKQELNAHQIPDSQHREVLQNIFTKLKPRYDDLISAIANEFEAFGCKIGASKAKKFKTYYETKGWIEPHKEPGSRYPIYKLTQPV